MKLRTMGRHIKEAFKSLVRNGWMSLAAVSAVAVTLLLVGSFIALLMNVNKLASDVENDVSVRVYIDLAATEEQQSQLGEDLEKLPEVETVEYSSREDELQQVVGTYGTEFDLFEGDDNPLHDVYIVNTNSPEQTSVVAEKVEEMEFVSQANYGGAEADKLFETMESVRNIGGVVIIALLLTAVFLISNTIRITIFSRRTEIEIMKLVGATNWFIRWPFVIEGALIGLVGAIIPTAIISAVYVYGYDMISNYFVGTYFSLLPVNPFLFQLGAVLLAVGIVIGAIGSLLSIRKFLRV
ncbi:permease-like cell division protein FtsX [Desemzia sp. FAM 23991]|uniref:permease-like cell division protein FtsX n=1 Tax=unclassified Desemzia TaxID=2685243 RepID=UPI00388AE04D